MVVSNTKAEWLSGITGMKSLLFLFLLVWIPSAAFAQSKDVYSAEAVDEAAKLVRAGSLFEAVSILSMSCSSGNLLSCSKLGWSQIRGELPRGPVSGDPMQLLEQSCNSNFAPACNYLGIAASSGIGRTRSISQSTGFFDRSCQLGQPYGCHMFAIALARGLGVSSDLPRAAEIAGRACDMGIGSACYNAGTINTEFLGRSERNWSLADKQFLFAAKMFGNSCDELPNVREPDECTSLAIMFIEGVGVARDVSNGFRLLDSLCKAQVERACSEQKERRVTAPNQEHPVSWYVERLKAYEAGCERGDAEACADAGHWNRTGYGRARDTVKGFTLLSRSCDLGRERSCWSLAEGFKRGDYVAANRDEELRYRLKGCDMGDANACFWAGDLQKSMFRMAAAHRTFQQGCGLGSKEACVMADRLK